MSHVEAAWKILLWAMKRRQDDLENGVLNTFGHRNWPWLSGRGVVARMKHDAACEFARALFPPSVSELPSTPFEG